MNETTAGQAAEPWRAAWMAFIAVTDPGRELSELAGDDETDPQWIAAWQAAATAVETGQVRLAREDRDGLRKRMLDLAAELEDQAAQLEAAGGSYGGRMLRRETAGRIRKALDL